MLKREWGAESNRKLPHLFITGKTTALVSAFLGLRWKTWLRQNCSLGSCACNEGPALGQNLWWRWYCIFYVRNGSRKLYRMLCISSLFHKYRKWFRIGLFLENFKNTVQTIFVPFSQVFYLSENTSFYSARWHIGWCELPILKTKDTRYFVRNVCEGPKSKF